MHIFPCTSYFSTLLETTDDKTAFMSCFFFFFFIIVKPLGHLEGHFISSSAHVKFLRRWLQEFDSGLELTQKVFLQSDAVSF